MEFIPALVLFLVVVVGIISIAERKFQKEAVIKYDLACCCCQLAEIENAKNYLKKSL